MYMHVKVHTCICICMCTCICTCVWVCIYVYVYVHSGWQKNDYLSGALRTANMEPEKEPFMYCGSL